MRVDRPTGNAAGFVSQVVAWSIVIYQRFISPVKGFTCAHRYRHGGASCSEHARQVVLNRGIVSGYADIRSRFHACRAAALEIQRNTPRKQAGALDCGFDSCGDAGSCFDGGGAGGGGAEGGRGKSTTIIVIPSGILVILLIIAASAWFKGPRVNAIDIRLVENQQETQERGVARLLGGKNPDYQVVFFVDGKNISTNTLTDSTARSWLRLEPRSEFRFSELERITIVNKQLLDDEILEVIDNPQRQGRGEIYEYRLAEEQTF